VKRSRAICVAVLASVVIAASWAKYSEAFIRSQIGKEFAVPGSSMSDVLGYFSRRSPGARETGALYQTKQKTLPAHLANAKSAPFERVLSNVRQAPPANPLLENDPLASLLDTPGLFADPLNGGDPFSPSSLTSPSNTGSPLTNSGFLPAATPLAPADLSGGTSPVVPSPSGSSLGGTTPDAVPEPATWLTMIVGLFLMGGAFRANGRRDLLRASKGNA